MPRWSGGALVMSRPSTAMRPAFTGTKPETARSRVVLPQPEGPSRATNSPAATASETRLSTGVAPYDTSTSATSSAALAMRKDYSTTKTLGVVGLGIMGGAMAEALLAAGYAVCGYDPVTAAASRLKR